MKVISQIAGHSLEEGKSSFEYPLIILSTFCVCSRRSIRYKLDILFWGCGQCETKHQHFKKTVWRAPWSKLPLDVYHLFVPQLKTLMFLSQSTHLSGLAPSLSVYHRSLAQTSCRQSGCLDSLESCSRLWHHSQHGEKMFVNFVQIAAEARGSPSHLSFLFSAGPYTPEAKRNTA